MKTPIQPFTTNDTLNPVLWDNDTLKPLVRFKLLSIAKDFIKSLKVPNLKLQDITISGSNAGYGYSKYSDIDLHLIVDVDNEELEDYYNAKKTLYNIKYNITVKDIPVEVYVQKASQPHYSAGIYSILDNKWIHQPGKETTNVDIDMVKQKAKDYAASIKQALKSNNLEIATTALDDIGRLRKAGLEAGGEQSLENYAFKLIRSKGLVDKLRKYVDRLKTDELSLKEYMKIYEILREDPITTSGTVSKVDGENTTIKDAAGKETTVPTTSIQTGPDGKPTLEVPNVASGQQINIQTATTEATEEEEEEDDLVSRHGNKNIGGGDYEDEDGAGDFINDVVDHEWERNAGRGMSSRALGNRSPVSGNDELNRWLTIAGIK